MNRLLSRVAALCLAVVLFSQPAFSHSDPITRSGKEPGVLTAVRQFLLFLVPSIGQAHGTMDPNGNTSSGPTPETGTPPPPTMETNAHGTMDPDGGTANFASHCGSVLAPRNAAAILATHEGLPALFPVVLVWRRLHRQIAAQRLKGGSTRRATRPLRL